MIDPACGSGGMFVQSANFIDEHKKNGDSAEKNISIYGQEKTLETVHLCKMNLAVHGLSGDVKQANTMYEDVFKCNGQFDYVMANPPFNVDGVDKEKLKDDKRFPLGMPNTDNANYLWIQIFNSSLNKKGRAGFVMPNSASDARNSELEIRKKLINSGVVDVMISIGSNFFYTVTLSCTLWFFDKSKQGTNRQNKILFIDAKNIFRQIDKAHREFTPEQVEYISSIVRMYRDENVDDFLPSLERSKLILSKLEPSSIEEEKEIFDRLKIIEQIKIEWLENFKDNKYFDIAGLCSVKESLKFEDFGWSLNPNQYVGIRKKDEIEYDYKEKIKDLNNELMSLNKEAESIMSEIDQNVNEIIN